jgi:hypothetical protein
VLEGELCKVGVLANWESRQDHLRQLGRLFASLAAAVLMPARLIQEQYISCNRDFFRLCGTFGASGAAMGRRLHAVIKRGAVH